MEAPNTSRPRQGTHTPAIATKRKRPPRWVIVSPEIGSLYDILHDHAGVSLYVLPICWTDLHTRLLGCRFVQLSPFTTPIPLSLSSPLHSSTTPSPSPPSSSPRHPLKPPPVAITIGRALDVLMSKDKPILSKNRAMSAVISKFFPEHLLKTHDNADLDLRFGCRHYPRAVRCQLLWNHTDVESNALSFDSATTWTASQAAGHSLASTAVANPIKSPVLAYVNRSHLNFVRRNGFRISSGPEGIFNHPVRRLQTLRSKNLLPKNPDEDSYLLAVMLAMAQKSAYEDISSGAGFTPRNVKVRVVTVAEDENAFMVYTATIPSAFLSMFHEPGLAAAGNAEIAVEYTHVPVWPILGFKERLGMALGADLVGHFDSIRMDIYDNDPVPILECSSPKRKREIFSEVFNASFSENRESDSSRDIFRKRQCIKEGRVGVVR
ncbi:hypothetical protein F4861DRAFT_18988 [Xylaria intraflava]|nr:hypothetical protein F4861DRAFT_18988 [Xylaria intraflava]